MSDLESLSQKNTGFTAGISRRELMLGIGAVAAATYTGAAVSAMPAHDHSKHSAQLPDCSMRPTTALIKASAVVRTVSCPFRKVT